MASVRSATFARPARIELLVRAPRGGAICAVEPWQPHFRGATARLWREDGATLRPTTLLSGRDYHGEVVAAAFAAEGERVALAWSAEHLEDEETPSYVGLWRTTPRAPAPLGTSDAPTLSAKAKKRAPLWSARMPETHEPCDIALAVSPSGALVAACVQWEKHVFSSGGTTVHVGIEVCALALVDDATLVVVDDRGTLETWNIAEPAYPRLIAREKGAFGEEPTLTVPNAGRFVVSGGSTLHVFEVDQDRFLPLDRFDAPFLPDAVGSTDSGELWCARAAGRAASVWSSARGGFDALDVGVIDKLALSEATLVVAGDDSIACYGLAAVAELPRLSPQARLEASIDAAPVVEIEALVDDATDALATANTLLALAHERIDAGARYRQVVAMLSERRSRLLAHSARPLTAMVDICVAETLSALSARLAQETGARIEASLRAGIDASDALQAGTEGVAVLEQLFARDMAAELHMVAERVLAIPGLHHGETELLLGCLALLHREDAERTIAHLERAFAARPDLYVAAHWLGYAYLRRKVPADVAAGCTRAIAVFAHARRLAAAPTCDEDARISRLVWAHPRAHSLVGMEELSLEQLERQARDKMASLP